MPNKKILLLLCQGTEIFEAAAFIDVMGWSGTYGSEPVQVVTAALSNTHVTCAFGLKIGADILLNDVDPIAFDALAIPGGFEEYGFYSDAYSSEVQSLISQFADLKKPIASICVGALPLAKTGLLKGKAATTYHLLDGKRRKQLVDMGAIVLDQAVVHDGLFFTSTSPATAIDVAFRLLEVLTGKANSDHIRYLMGFTNVPA